MRIIVIGSRELSSALAAHLRLDPVAEVGEIATDGFVLDGTALTVSDARALDAVLRTRAAEIDAVLVLGHAAGSEDVLAHYFGRVIELDPADPFEDALAGLREVLLAA